MFDTAAPQSDVTTLEPNSFSTEEATYNPGIFNVTSEEQARDIILTREADQDSRERWIRETPYLTDLILSKIKIDKKCFILDFGCGVGRIAKELINKTDCTVVGVDISASMRGFAAPYVDDDKFFSCSPRSLELITHRTIKFDAAIAVWTLQHCLEPEDDLRVIRHALYPGGKLFVANNRTRVVPTIERGWVNDGIDIQDLIKTVGFRELEKGALDPTVVPQAVSEETFWAIYSEL